MADIQITVAQVQQPPPGKQKGSVKDVSGKYWFVWPQDLNAFQPGGTYRITDYDTYNAQNGKVYYTIKRYQQVVGVGGSGGASNQMPPPNRPMTPTTDDSQRRLDIFVCGAVNNYLANPNINPDSLSAVDIVDIIQKFKQGWMGVFGPSPLPRQVAQRQDPISSGSQRTAPGTVSHNDDMNDDIPF
jgi:hypothetical protein